MRGPGEASGQLLDLGRQLEAGHDGLELELLGFDTAEGRAVFWHSSAHVLGQALEAYHGDDVLLCDGPALEEGGFFYEMHLAGEQRITEAAYGALERLVKRFGKKRQAFQRLEVTREFAAEVFGENKFKLEMLSRIPEGEPVTLYRCGEFVDLCRGPHLPHTGLLKGFTVYARFPRTAASRGRTALPPALAPRMQVPLFWVSLALDGCERRWSGKQRRQSIDHGGSAAAARVRDSVSVQGRAESMARAHGRGTEARPSHHWKAARAVFLP